MPEKQYDCPHCSSSVGAELWHILEGSDGLFYDDNVEDIECPTCSQMFAGRVKIIKDTITFEVEKLDEDECPDCDGTGRDEEGNECNACWG